VSRLAVDVSRSIESASSWKLCGTSRCLALQDVSRVKSKSHDSSSTSPTPQFALNALNANGSTNQEAKEWC
jgi:hypothetical protein